MATAVTRRARDRKKAPLQRAGKSIEARAHGLLAYARRAAESASSWVELSNAVFGVGGRYVQLFATESERLAASKSDPVKQVWDLIWQVRDRLGDPAPLAGQFEHVQGHISVRLPRSMHAALLAEAEREGVSLNQLCVAKLGVQLRAVV